jgi:hypothetical protein
MIRGKIHGGVAYSCVGCVPANHAIPVIGCGYRPRLTALINGLGLLCRTSASGGNQPKIVTSLFGRVCYRTAAGRSSNLSNDLFTHDSGLNDPGLLATASTLFPS